MRKMSLASYILLPLLFLSQIVLSSAQESKRTRGCSPFTCVWLKDVRFPFTTVGNPGCGLCFMNCTDKPKVQFHQQGKWHYVDAIMNDESIIIRDLDLETHLASNRCDLLSNFTDQVSPFLSINVIHTYPFFKCKREAYPTSPPKFFNNMFHNYNSCKDYDLYFYDNQTKSLPPLPENLSTRCSVINLPPSKIHPFDSGLDTVHNLTLLWDYIFTVNLTVLPDCQKCHHKGGQCTSSPNGTLVCGNLKGKNIRLKIGIGLGAGILGIIISCGIIYICRHKKGKLFKKSSALISRSMSFDDSLKPDPEMGSTYFQTPIFTYKELDEATNHFDTNKELGDGGFGTVYHGKLRDGRVVAVKRLFEHNYKRVEQFMNEIVILSQVRHRNLVSLYGCTNRHSRELLLVYEYVPNGTVADHLHGDHAKKGLLTWPIRMSIAIESADALAYLHASDIIHRDVKTNNILLDDGFHVKVADFGLSRLFPTDVTHVSTAPQGTPGYVDPEYYQCYQLNDKSDVYSFGVVLIELISSKQAVDIGRHRHEINLASMAINKIHNRAIHELVDPTLGFESDYNVRNMITLVAELAFRCLQQEKEMRPCMVEVLETLRGIENEEYKKSDDLDIPADARLLKNSQPLSPDSVTDLWGSKATTPNTSA